MNIKKILDAIEYLSPISPVSLRLITVLNDPDDFDIKQVSNIITNDPAIVINLLKLVNSAYYALHRKIDSVQQAITYLGFNKIYELIILQSLSGIFRKDCSAYFLSGLDLWRHSACSAFLAKEIGIKIGYDSNGLNALFTAALIKDIGKVVLHQFFPEQTNRILQAVSSQKISFDEAEAQIIGINHPDVGAKIAEKWRLPENIVKVIRNHHVESTDKMIMIIQSGDYITSMMGIGAGVDGLAYHLGKSLGMLLDDAALQAVMIKFLQQKNELFKMIESI